MFNKREERTNIKIVQENIDWISFVLDFFSEIEELAAHGITLPPNMQGLTDEQIEELKLKDEWATKCEPSGGHVFKKDEVGRRNGHGRYIEL